MPAPKRLSAPATIPTPHNWRTSDADEIERRQLRARTEGFRIVNADARHPIFSNFHVASRSGLTYSVEVRDVRGRQFACECVDFRINGLGTCKHVEAVLGHLEARHPRAFAAAGRNGTARLDLVPDSERDGLRLVASNGVPLPPALRALFDREGRLLDVPLVELAGIIEELRARAPSLRISQEVAPWLETQRRAAERKELRRVYEQKVQRGEWPAHETKVPLFPYQREGMLHLAFTERALLADEMGLGKTIQAIAACALLHRLGQARRVLVVTPASLKTEWEEQIQRFTELPLQLVFGPRHERLRHYDPRGAPFFTIVNYEQMRADALEVNVRLAPEIVVLDEAQRIKNWSAQTTQAIKRLRSRYAFVLTGTPIENRIDELHSLMDFLNPAVLGPLFRFNREYYELDERGRPAAYRNLDKLRERISPYLLRRRKADVETELPDRTDRNLFVPLAPTQKAEYDGHADIVARLAAQARRRPLSPQEQEKMMRELAMMRMVCDTNYILDADDRECPKLAELEKLLETCRENDAKVIVFSEWERMLELARELCGRLGLGFAWHTGSVPQRRRRAEINAFKTDPQCRVFLSTDSGSTGLNLQVASVVINCDLPWNPAKLEQRIARAWRKHQTRAVTVINLVAENTIEHRMLETLAQKQALASGVLDRLGDLKEIKLRSGAQKFLARLDQLMSAKAAAATPAAPPGPEPRPELPADRSLGFARKARAQIDGALICCEERYPAQGAHSVLYVVVERDAAQHRDRLASLHQEFFGHGAGDPLAPVQLEVVDRATHDALERLAAAGLLTLTTRGARPLLPEPLANEGPAPLSAEERAKVDAHRAAATRKLKMARLLGDGGLAEEARIPLLEAALSLARALAVEQRWSQPASLDETLAPPFAFAWKDVLAPLRRFAADASTPWTEPAGILAQRLLPQSNASNCDQLKPSAPGKV
jgi:superfamily II DNA or RNA helicase